MDAFFSNTTLFASTVFSLGFVTILIAAFVQRFVRRAQLQSEANAFIEEANEHAQDIEEACKIRVKDYEEQVLAAHELEIAKLEERVETLKTRVEDREADLEANFAEHEKNVSQQQSTVDSYENRVRTIEKRVEQRRDAVQQVLNKFIAQLESKTEVTRKEVVSALQAKMLDDKKIEMAKKIQTVDEEWQRQAELEAKKLLTTAINRFARPYCPERGIGYLNFENEEQKKRILAHDQEILRYVEKQCGVDLAYDENNNAINVYGFDPVRRELGRATMEKLFTEKNLTPDRVDQVVARCKKDLYQRILKDGDRVANELRVDRLSPEIKNMMGALRYRYSFTQNQYFHCAEVGYLCGLLASELDVPLKDARRAGLLHDIGKAMDHSIDGGHAVIGADFIKQNGEADHIVHAVRSHHFDEQPTTDLCYLVIAADAISGARPGARRSTVATYTQKIQDLQSIARGFEGVSDTHVLSAGREIRVYVDGRQIDDLRALDISKEIAHKIETDMQYPGQIRVTVVRETHAVEYAK